MDQKDSDCDGLGDACDTSTTPVLFGCGASVPVAHDPFTEIFDPIGPVAQPEVIPVIVVRAR